MTRTGKKRFICSFVKKMSDGELKPNVVVIAADNSIVAKALLCQTYGVVNKEIPKERHWANDTEGIKKIRQAETNVYEGESEGDNFGDNT